MTGRRLRGLIALNALLLAALVAFSLTETETQGQAFGSERGSYVMVAAKMPGRPANSVYITDINRAALLVVTPRSPRGPLEPNEFRYIREDFTTTGSRR